MNFKIKVAFLLILLFGHQMKSNGQTITFNILKKMIASREYKDSIMNSFKFIRKTHIPATEYVVEFESFMSSDSSKIIELIYKDSAIGCIFWTKNLNLLQKIISDGQIDGFVRTSGVIPNPKATVYIKGKYALLFTNNVQDKRKSNVSLTKNYPSMNVPLRAN